jgi:hydroxymethylpyrimidine pyrophosphatase-like HAD family hydrolase
VAGAIAENGGLYYANSKEAIALSSIPNPIEHRQKLAQMFAELQREFPKIRESTDNQFRLTDWTFDVQGLRWEELQQMQCRCHQQGWGFTYSTVQCHIKPLHQEKALGLQTVLSRYFPHLTPMQVVTVGDSPNDQSLFDATYFPVSVGVANIQHYAAQITHLPAYMTQNAEVAGFCELASHILEIVEK